MFDRLREDTEQRKQRQGYLRFIGVIPGSIYCPAPDLERLDFGNLADEDIRQLEAELKIPPPPTLTVDIEIEKT